MDMYIYIYIYYIYIYIYNIYKCIYSQFSRTTFSNKFIGPDLLML